jgi:hypothetical protein
VCRVAAPDYSIEKNDMYEGSLRSLRPGCIGPPRVPPEGNARRQALPATVRRARHRAGARRAPARRMPTPPRPCGDSPRCATKTCRGVRHLKLPAGLPGGATPSSLALLRGLAAQGRRRRDERHGRGETSGGASGALEKPPPRLTLPNFFRTPNGPAGSVNTPPGARIAPVPRRNAFFAQPVAPPDRAEAIACGPGRLTMTWPA